MKKLLAVMLLLALVLSLLAACGSDKTEAAPGAGGKAVAGRKTQPGARENAGTENPVAESALPPIPAIVFDETVADPFLEKVGNMPGAEGTATLSLTLLETSPGVYTGDGALIRKTKMQARDTVMTSDIYYRLSFQELKTGEASRCIAAAFNVTDQSGPFDTGLSVYNTHVRATQLKEAEFLLTVDGDAARLAGFECEFSGGVTQSPPVNPSFGSLTGRALCINGTFYESGKSYNHEYRATLTAAASGSEYAGDLFVYSSDESFTPVDQAVRFTLQPFDAKAYKDAGGRLTGGFDAFGVIDASGGNYIVLLDGERPLIESVNRELVFYGAFIPEDEAEAAKHRADETKQLTKTLYDGADKTKSTGNQTPQFWSGTPPWYPEWLIPALPGSYGWGWYEMFNEQGFNRYRMQLTAEDFFDAVLDFYTSQLSGCDNYDFADTGDGYASICFSKGIYNIMVVIMPAGRFVDVGIYIT